MANSEIDFKFLTLLSDVVEISKNQLKNHVAGTKAFIIGTGWRASLYWVLKLEWTGTKLKAPLLKEITRNVIKADEKHGRLMHSVLGLCKAAHPFKDKKWEYDSWLDWFEKIVKEAAQASYNLEEKSKTRKLEKQRECLKLLNDLKNPYEPDTHLWRLIEIWRTRLAELSEPEKEYWIPFKRHFSEWLTKRDSSRWGCLFKEQTETRLTLKSTNGQGHRYLNLACTILVKN